MHLSVCFIFGHLKVFQNFPIKNGAILNFMGSISLIHIYSVFWVDRSSHFDVFLSGFCINKKKTLEIVDVAN